MSKNKKITIEKKVILLSILIIFVSHSMTQVEKFCDRVIYLNNHQIFADGKPQQSIEKYLCLKTK